MTASIHTRHQGIESHAEAELFQRELQSLRKSICAVIALEPDAELGYIPQMIFLLDNTIRANVAFGVPERENDDEQIWRFFRKATLEEFVRFLPEGLDE